MRAADGRVFTVESTTGLRRPAEDGPKTAVPVVVEAHRAAASPRPRVAHSIHWIGRRPTNQANQRWNAVVPGSVVNTVSAPSGSVATQVM